MNVETDELGFSLFVYEDERVPLKLRLIERVLGRLKGSDRTLIQKARSPKEAARLIDGYKAKTCGSAYSVALINLNSFPSDEFFRLLMSDRALGDPWTIFLGTLRNIDGPIYALAREKIEGEANEIFGRSTADVPSCIDSYTQGGMDDAADRVAEILSVRLEEKMLLEQHGAGGERSMSLTEKAMRRSSTCFYGSVFASRSGRTGRISGHQRPIKEESSSSRQETRTYPGPGAKLL